ncbi:MAG: hypothetical protein MUF18_04465 [Fimbriiglobus sp.]|nr:hypothetical protein [Fimbriiglobus sp.]
MISTDTTGWVVFRMGSLAQRVGQNAVCTQAEWDARTLAYPGRDTLIRAGITNEGEAERFARDLQTPPPLPKPPRPAPVALSTD